MPEPYGSFSWICQHAPLPVCNILFRAAWDAGALTTLFPSNSAFFAHYNIVLLVIVSLFSVVVSLALVFRSFQNKLLGVGTTEFSFVLVTFALHSALQAITQSSMLLQGETDEDVLISGSTALLILSALHLAVVAMLMWLLLCNTMVLWGSYDERKTVYLGILSIGSAATFGVTVYLALATGYRWTHVFAFDPEIRSIALFTVILVWPAFALVATFLTMFYVAEYRMHEREPALWLLGSASALVAGQAVLFVASQPLCQASKNIVNGSFIAALMNLLSLALFYRAWNNMGEASWFATQAWNPRNSQRASAAPTKLKISFKAGGEASASAGRLNSFLGEYDRELDEHPDEPLAFEEQFILRVPQKVADGVGGEPGLRDLVRGKGKGLDGVEFKFLDTRRAAFKINGVTYSAKLVDLPNIIEAQKTHDSRHLFKAADISQMLLVENPVRDESSITASALNVDDYIWPHGITPPMRHVRKRRFRKRLSRRTIEVVEEQVEELLKKDEDADDNPQIDLIDVHHDPEVPDSYYVEWSAEDPYAGWRQGEATSEWGDGYEDPGSVATGADWYDEEGEEGEFEEGEEDDDDMDQDLQAALMETMERSSDEGSDDGLSDEEDEDDGGAEDDDEETLERKAKIKQYTGEIKQLETLIEKKRTGFTGGNPIITKRFEETIKGLQDDISTKVAARQVILDAIEKEQSDARAAAEAAAPKAPEEPVDDGDGLFEEEGEMDSNATPAATPGLLGATPAAEEYDDDDDLFGDADDGESDTGTAVANTPMPQIEVDVDMDVDADGLFGDDGDGDGDVDVEVQVEGVGHEVLLEEPDDEMAAMLQAELGDDDLFDDKGDDLFGDDGETAATDAAAAALDEFARETDAALNASLGGFAGVEGGVGMRRLASGVADDDDSSVEDSDDSD
ncbi:hypothetical protein CcaverHIS641_0101480 [Cutaneotrichosporon cavernicola]|nr:hypothetical protein CcaverHIS641_0101480 [Cutaneotrichosporon cavernicola]